MGSSRGTSTARAGFTDYVRSLGASGEPPDRESFEALLATLRRALVYEMKKRSLWSAPPSYLGIYGGSRWTEGDLLEELLLDCYLFIFIRRLPGLRKQLLVRRTIDGLIFLNIRNFLHEAQRRHDPLGFRIFEVLQEALLGLVERRTLFIVDGDPRVRNDTVFGFSSASEPGSARDVDLRPWAETWNGELLPDLVTAWRKDEIVARLERRISGLAGEGVEVFRFKNLVEPFKADVRARWYALQADAEDIALDGGGDELATIVRRVWPDSTFEDEQAFEKLLSCVAESLDRLAGRAKTKEYLRRLWFFVHAWTAEQETSGGAGERLPPDVRLGEELDIPRARIPKLKKTLGGLIQDCRRDIFEKPPVIGLGGGAGENPATGPRPVHAHGERTSAMDLESRRERLRQLTGEAAAGREGGGGSSAGPVGGRPRPGDLFVVAGTGGIPAEWLVVDERGRDPRRVLLVPVDDAPWCGSGDAELAGDPRRAAARVRCGVGAWVDGEALAREPRTGRLGAEVVEEVRRRRAAPPGEGAASARAVDDLVEYRRWIGALRGALRRLPGNPRVAAAGGDDARSTVVPFERPETRDSPAARRFSRRDALLAYGLAAILATVAAALSLWVAELRDELARPFLFPTRNVGELVVGDPGRPIETLEMTVTESHVLVHLLFDPWELPPRFRWELLRDEVVWSSAVREAEAQFLLAVPRRLVATGTYQLRVYAVAEGGVETLLGQRDVHVDLSGASSGGTSSDDRDR